MVVEGSRCPGPFPTPGGVASDVPGIIGLYVSAFPISDRFEYGGRGQLGISGL